MLIGEKINELQNLTKRKITKKEIADILGLGSSQAVINRINRNQKLENYEIIKLDDYFNKEINIINHVSTNSDSEPYIIGDYYPDVFGSCGNGAFVLSETKEKIHIPEKFIKNYSKTYKYSVINAISDSMIPEIMPKDLLVIQHYNGEPIKDNHIYIFMFEDTLYCKYLSRNLGQIIVRSENPIYPIRYIEKEQFNDLLIIGEVKGHFRRYDL